MLLRTRPILVLLTVFALPAFAVPWSLSANHITLGLEGNTLDIPLAAPAMRFEDGEVPACNVNAPANAAAILARGDVLEIACPPRALPKGGSLDTVLCLQWSEADSVLRKWARYRVQGAACRLDTVALDDLAIAKKQPVNGAVGGMGQPAFFPGLFCGVEFPAGVTRIEGERLFLSHSPGRTIDAGVWNETRCAVFGAAYAGQELRAFRRYIFNHRTAPNGVHIDYNSWWTSPVPYTEKDILELMKTFDEQFYKPYGGRFDSFCIDMGWSNAKTLWEIDRTLFPQGFTNVAQAAQRMGSSLGLWISPSGAYPQALDIPWGKANGYETMKDVFCLAGPHYQTAFATQTARLAEEFGLTQFKFDGYRPECFETDHGHQTGALSAEPMADGIIRAARAIHEKSPNLWIEPTCFGWNPSPWWLFHFNSVIGSYGDDAPFGRVPAPVHRESYTTARDFFNLQGTFWNPIPAAAQEVLGIIHQTSDPFMNDAVMTVMRGHRFLPAYVNPKYMNAQRWESLAALFDWTRRNVPRFEETFALLPPSWQNNRCPKFQADVPMPREPYGYAHRVNDGVLLVLRNPWIEAAEYALPLNASAGFPTTGEALNAVSLYPEARVYATGLRFGNVLRVPLAPYETLVLQLTPATPHPAPSAAEALRAGARAQVTESSLHNVVFDSAQAAFGPDWTSSIGDMPSGAQLHLAGTVQSGESDVSLLVLLDGATRLFDAHGTVDGKATALETTGSDTGWAASGLKKPEEWTFLRMPIPRGEHRIDVKVFCPGGETTVSAWLWNTRPGQSKNAANLLPQPETISLGTIPLLPATRVTSLPAESTARPIERIDGIFLDALQPVSCTMGWGSLGKNLSVWGKPIIIANTRYARGVGAHAPARIEYALEGAYRRFQAWVGADNATTPTVTFEVWTDGVKRWESGRMQKEDPAKRVDIDLTGATKLELVVGDGGNGLMGDHADWADARLLR